MIVVALIKVFSVVVVISSFIFLRISSCEWISHRFPPSFSASMAVFTSSNDVSPFLLPPFQRQLRMSRSIDLIKSLCFNPNNSLPPSHQLLSSLFLFFFFSHVPFSVPHLATTTRRQFLHSLSPDNIISPVAKRNNRCRWLLNTGVDFLPTCLSFFLSFIYSFDREK